MLGSTVPKEYPPPPTEPKKLLAHAKCVTQAYCEALAASNQLKHEIEVNSTWAWAKTDEVLEHMKTAENKLAEMMDPFSREFALMNDRPLSNKYQEHEWLSCLRSFCCLEKHIGLLRSEIEPIVQMSEIRVIHR